MLIMPYTIYVLIYACVDPVIGMKKELIRFSIARDVSAIQKLTHRIMCNRAQIVSDAAVEGPDKHSRMYGLSTEAQV
jgi:hypothetical protein